MCSNGSRTSRGISREYARWWRRISTALTSYAKPTRYARLWRSWKRLSWRDIYIPVSQRGLKAIVKSRSLRNCFNSIRLPEISSSLPCFQGVARSFYLCQGGKTIPLRYRSAWEVPHIGGMELQILIHSSIQSVASRTSGVGGMNIKNHFCVDMRHYQRRICIHGIDNSCRSRHFLRKLPARD